MGLSTEEQKVFEEDINKLIPLIDNVQEYLDDLDKRGVTLPALKYYSDVVRADLDEEILHAIYKHGMNPAYAADSALNNALVRAFVLGFLFGKAGLRLQEISAKEVPDKGMSDFN